MITFLICLILVIISLMFISTGSIFLIILGADLIVCAAIIWKIIHHGKKE